MLACCYFSWVVLVKLFILVGLWVFFPLQWYNSLHRLCCFGTITCLLVCDDHVGGRIICAYSKPRSLEDFRWQSILELRSLVQAERVKLLT